jgi:beta-lactamase regulating signal transducer with metallopeptidase domain
MNLAGKVIKMDVLRSLLEITIYSAVLFAAIKLFKKAAKGKISPVLSFALWFLLLARLCLPVTVDSGYHLITLPAVQQHAAQETLAGSEGGLQQSPVITDQITPFPRDARTLTPSAAPAYQTPAKTFSADIYDVLLIVWLCGASLTAAWTVYIAAGVSKAANKKSVPAPAGIQKIYEKCLEEMGIRKRLPLLITQDLSSPALLVSFRPKILLPLKFAKEATDAQAELALRHELTHYRRMDHLLCMLMDILSIIYWFNPVVWLAEKEIVSDMEIACDNRIVRNMEKDEKTRYASTILSMLSQRGDLPYALGMALTNTKNMAEKRIRGIYMKNKSKKGVKTSALLLALVMLAACFTTACQPASARETEAAAAFDVVSSTPAASASPQTPAPTLTPESAQASNEPEESFTKSNKLSDTVTVNYDASIVRPQGNIPVASMEIRNITEEDVKKVSDYFFAGRQAYNPWVRTKAEIQADLDALEEENSQIAANKEQFIASHPWAEEMNKSIQENGGNAAPAYNKKEDYGISEDDWAAYSNACSSADTAIAVNNYYMEQSKQELETAPETADKQPATIEFKDYNLGRSVIGGGGKVVAGDEDVVQNMAIVWAESSNNTISEVDGYNIDNSRNGCVRYCRQLENGNFSGILFNQSAREQLNMPQEQAQKLADDAVRAICPELSLGGAKVFQYYDKTGVNMVDGYYVFTFVRNVGNVPVTYDSWGGVQFYSNETDEAIGYEQIQIYVDNYGIVSMIWNNPYGDIRITDDNAQVISLEQAREAFEKNLLEEFKSDRNVISGVGADSITLDIDKIQLGLTRVSDEDGNFTLVPTWDFFGKASATRGGENLVFNRFGQSQGNDSLGTVNALDGSEIIRQGDTQNW